MPEENNCPQSKCGRPESNHRFSAGRRLSICANGHAWDAVKIAVQRATKQAAEQQEAREDLAESQTDPRGFAGPKVTRWP